jgi:hypothetical protein
MMEEIIIKHEKIRRDKDKNEEKRQNKAGNKQRE